MSSGDWRGSFDKLAMRSNDRANCWTLSARASVAKVSQFDVFTGCRTVTAHLQG